MEIPIYAGIAGISSEAGSCELGEGVILKNTYAHFMAPFLMAFKEPEEGKPHPAPWSAVGEGIVADINLELYIPPEFNPPAPFDRINTAWWIVSLIRRRGYHFARVPAIAHQPFSAFRQSSSGSPITPVEILPPQAISNRTLTNLTYADLNWVKETWIKGARLMDENSKFYAAYRLIDYAGFLQYKPMILLTLWGALEQLFSPANQELRFRISTYIAAFLEPPGPSRLRLYEQLFRQYDMRSKVAHGEMPKVDEDLELMACITQRALDKVFSLGHVPTKGEIERLLFS